MTDHERLNKIATHLNECIDFGSYQPEEVKALQKEVTSISERLVPDGVPTQRDAIIYECQALIYWLKGDEKNAREFAGIATDLRKGPLHTPHGKTLAGNPKTGPSGVGGWLTFFSVGIVLSMLLSVFNIWSALSSASVFEQYGYVWWLVLDGMGILALVGIGVAYFVFLAKRSVYARNLAIGYLVFVVLLNGMDLIVLAQFYQTLGTSGDGSDGADFGRAILACAIWIPYLLTSKRVKNTLVN